ncbi:MAG: hypothetical protein ACKON9_02035, partial [Planctomycetaceae bacterium]
VSEASPDAGVACTGAAAAGPAAAESVLPGAGVGTAATGFADSLPPQPEIAARPIKIQPVVCRWEVVIAIDPSTFAEAQACPGHESFSAE